MLSSFYNNLRFRVKKFFSLGSTSASVRSRPIGLDDGLVNVDHVVHGRAELHRQANVLHLNNPFYKRGLLTLEAYILGPSFKFDCEDKQLKTHIQDVIEGLVFDDFLSQAFREVIKSGDLFVACHLLDDKIELRVIPTSKIKNIVTDTEDYTRELEYHEHGLVDNKIWYSWQHPEPQNPYVFHYSINKDAGQTRGFGEFASSHLWMQRYSSLLRDRVHVNVLLKSFFWFVSIPEKWWDTFKDIFASPPKAGTTVTVPKGVEIKSVSPNLGAKDFQYDRRAILEYVSAGVSGLTPIDFGELETSNLATAKVAGSNKAVIMRRLQRSYFSFISLVMIYSINRQHNTSYQRNDLSIFLHPIENFDAVDAGHKITQTFASFVETFGESEELRQMLLNMFINMMNTELSRQDFESIVQHKSKKGR